MPATQPLLERLLAAFPPQAARARGDAPNDLDRLRRSLPTELVDVYQSQGPGKLGDGLLELIDPIAYAPAYVAFFGGDAGGRVPFLLTAMGEPIAYKPIGPREAELSILHVYGPQIAVLAYSLDDFLDRVLLTDDGLRQVVNVPLYERLRARLGRLRPGQCYGFDPGLLSEAPAGTKADDSWFEVVEALDHLALLLRRAEQA